MDVTTSKASSEHTTQHFFKVVFKKQINISRFLSVLKEYLN
jgi:hypothetical protein